MKKKDKEVEGGSPSRPSPNNKSKQTDESQKPSKVIKKEAIQKSERGNMTGKKGYNETPPTVPIKSGKK